MDQNSSTTKAPPRKMRFTPKIPPKRDQKPVLPKVEKAEHDIDVAKAEQLLRRFKEGSLSGKPKVERKFAPVKVAFGYGESASSVKSYGPRKAINKNEGSSSHGGVEKDYKEPWDYYTYYPITHPLRRPYSGNPEILDEEEFGVDPQTSTYDENSTNPAAELGLSEENTENSMFLFQLPTIMPTSKRSEVNEPGNNANVAKGRGVSGKLCNLEALPEGLMGKMLIYKSGIVKLKLGETMYDVSPGLDCVFAQDVIAVNTEDKHCCNIGELTKRAVVTPDIDTMLNDMLS